jgi:hypothetical protein
VGKRHLKQYSLMDKVQDFEKGFEMHYAMNA